MPTSQIKLILRRLPIILVLLVGLQYAPISFSAGPDTMSYQGVLTDAGGTPSTGSHSMVFSIYNVISGGSALWTETQSSVAVNAGLFTVELGSVTAFPNSMFDQPLWLGMNVNGDGEMSPRTALTAVGFSFETSTIANHIAKRTGVISHGGTIPLPSYGDGTQAVNSQCVFTVSPKTFDSATTGWGTAQNYTVNGSRVVTAQSRQADQAVVYRNANYMIICTR